MGGGKGRERLTGAGVTFILFPVQIQSTSARLKPDPKQNLQNVLHINDSWLSSVCF